MQNVGYKYMSAKKLKMTIQSDIRNVPLVGTTMRAVCSAVFPGEDFYEVELCISEILGNVIEHTFNNAGDYIIDISIDIIGNDIYIEILDNGEALAEDIAEYINSNDVPSFEIATDDIEHIPERGRGLSIVKSVMDNFTYEYKSGKNLYSMKKCVVIED